MKKYMNWIIAICISLSLLLTGCGLSGFDLGAYVEQAMVVPFDEMEYSRPELEDFWQQIQSVEDGLEKNLRTEALMDRIFKVYDSYYDFYTNYFLADIRYCLDITDIYWEQEYNYCMSQTAQVDAAIDQMLYTLADCPLKEELEHPDYFGADFFDSYEGDSIWDETFTALMEQENALISQYYDLNAQAAETEPYSDAFFEKYGAKMGDLFVELVALRQEIATYVGYESYIEFANDFYYYRDYTPDQAEAYLEEIREKLVPLYREMDLNVIWGISGKPSSEQETLDYVKTCALAMGGTVENAFRLMEKGKLYDISYNQNKYNASFQVYLYKYAQPFVFVNPSGTVYDQLTFAHEFGHFCNDYASGGSAAGIDVKEAFSQGMEYLSLCYVPDAEDMEKLKMASCLSTYVEQSMYACFEQQVYQLEKEELTAENVYNLYEQIGLSYGFDTWGWDSRDFVVVPHFFTNPMYIISYVVSNDAALQLYQREKANAGTGLKLLQDNLTTEEVYFLAFLDAAGLDSPFATGRLDGVRDTLEQILN